MKRQIEENNEANDQIETKKYKEFDNSAFINSFTTITEADKQKFTTNDYEIFCNEPMSISTFNLNYHISISYSVLLTFFVKTKSPISLNVFKGFVLDTESHCYSSIYIVDIYSVIKGSEAISLQLMDATILPWYSLISNQSHHDRNVLLTELKEFVFLAEEGNVPDDQIFLAVLI